MKLAMTILVLGLAATCAFAADDLLVADFEGADYGAWKAEGEAFGPGPAQGTLPGQMPVDGFRGHGLVNSFYKGDGTIGTLTSPEFKIERKYINFLVGGGKYPGQTCVDLIVDGKTVRTSTGPNDTPGGSERLDWATWDVSDLAGNMAVIRVVDKATGGWGHVNVDNIVQSDKKAPVKTMKSRQLALDKPFLSLPVKTGAPKCMYTVEVDGHAVREFEIEAAEGEPDFVTYLDVRAWQGKPATLKADGVFEDNRMKREVPRRIPRELPCIRHGHDRGVIHVPPVTVAGFAPFRGRRRLRGVAVQPFRDIVVVELLRPDHSGQSLALHKTGVGVVDALL